MPANRNNPGPFDPPPGADLATGSGLQVSAELSASLGRVAQAFEDHASRQQMLWSAIRPLEIPVPPITSSTGTADYPELLAPRAGYWWDVKAITAATFSGGSVNVYAGGQVGALSDTNLVMVFTQAGTTTLGTGQLLVRPQTRLIFKAVSTTGSVSPSLRVIEIASWALPSYLM